MQSANKEAAERLLKIEEVATTTGLTVGHIRKLMRKSDFPYYKIGYAVRFKLPEVNGWLESFRANKH